MGGAGWGCGEPGSILTPKTFIQIRNVKVIKILKTKFHWKKNWDTPSRKVLLKLNVHTMTYCLLRWRF